jgi:hypothetical protein
MNFEWITNNIGLISVLLTSILALAAISSAIIAIISASSTRKLILLNAQPMIRIDIEDIEIFPNITVENMEALEEYIKNTDERVAISLNIKLSNIGNQLAQSVYLDGGVNFHILKPYNHNFLPIHLPQFEDIIPKYNTEDSSTLFRMMISYDNYLAKQILLDFIELKKKHYGLPFLPTENETAKSKEWVSPKLSIKCYYSDILGTRYEASKVLFFHMYLGDDKQIHLYKLSMAELDFTKTKRISVKTLENTMKNLVHLRYTSFDGKKYKKNDRLVLYRKSTISKKAE